MADAVGRMREPWQSDGRASRANPHPNPPPVGEGRRAPATQSHVAQVLRRELLLLLALKGAFPFSLGEKVAGEARRMREPWRSHGRASRANPHPNPPPVEEGRRAPATQSHVAPALRSKALLLLALLAALAGPALAVQPDEVMKDPALEARARALSSELRCLVCQNELIDDSEAPLARDIRILIRERIGKGESNDAVRDYLVSRYGDFILLKPPFKPETLLLWLSPVHHARPWRHGGALRPPPRAQRNATPERRRGSAARGADQWRCKQRLTSRGTLNATLSLALRAERGALRHEGGQHIQKLIALAVALTLVPALSTSAFASSCSREVVAKVRFTARQACWTYNGPATLFVGKFSSGQTVSAQMTGEATDYDPRSGDTTKVSRPRDPNVEGPGGYFFAVPDAPGIMTFVAPATGTYRFSFSPCAMWGAPGAVRICTR